jgi:hypothetical protein
MKQHLKIEELKHGYVYQMNARNATYGVWNKNKGEFVISRFKFYDNYTFEETHYDLKGTARPYKEIEKCPYDVENYDEKNMLTYLNNFDKIECDECGRKKNEWVRHESWCPNR